MTVEEGEEEVAGGAAAAAAMTALLLKLVAASEGGVALEVVLLPLPTPGGNDEFLADTVILGSEDIVAEADPNNACAAISCGATVPTLFCILLAFVPSPEPTDSGAGIILSLILLILFMSISRLLKLKIL